MKSIICTAANQTFASLAFDLFQSIHNKAANANIAIGLLDTGLTENTVKQLRPHVTHVVTPGWDVDFANLHRTDNSYPNEKWLRDSQGMQAMTARP